MQHTNVNDDRLCIPCYADGKSVWQNPPVTCPIPTLTCDYANLTEFKRQNATLAFWLLKALIRMVNVCFVGSIYVWHLWASYVRDWGWGKVLCMYVHFLIGWTRWFCLEWWQWNWIVNCMHSYIHMHNVTCTCIAHVGLDIIKNVTSASYKLWGYILSLSSHNIFSLLKELNIMAIYMYNMIDKLQRVNQCLEYLVWYIQRPLKMLEKIWVALHNYK